MNASAAPAPGIRLDIQALRGLAVLVVVLYHAKLGGVQSGYLGVDIFFVISGYLITAIVAAGIARGSFGLAAFYARRAKRLLPAAYATLALAVGCAPWFLNHQDLRDFSLQVVGAVSFTANIVLWQQTGYFESASDLKPLLHMWSLSLEEQYYLVLPAALLLLPRRAWLGGVLAALAASLALCVIGSVHDPAATFYLLPTRAWELLLGSLGALLAREPDRSGRLMRLTSRAVRWLFYPGLALLLLLPLLPSFGPHPGPAAWLVCVATLVVLLRQHPGLPSWLPTRLLARLGDISYSLYLVHWPVIVFMRHAWVGRDADLPWPLRVAAVGVSLALSVVLYRCIEDPVRKSAWRFTPARAGMVLLVSLSLMALVPAWTWLRQPPANFAELRRPNLGLSAACDDEQLFQPRPRCMSAPQPRVLVWGDSFAMHLVPGLAGERRAGGVLQATRSTCGPFLGLAPTQPRGAGTGGGYDRQWAERCIAFNQSVLDVLARSDSLEVVVLSSALLQYVNEGWRQVAVTVQGVTESAPSVEAAAAAMAQTARAVRAAGKKVVFFAPPPSADVDVGACLERQLSGRLRIGAETDCTIPVSDYQARRARVLALTAAIERAGVPVIRLADFLCDREACVTMLDGTLVYRDAGHLSYDGSRLLATRMDWQRLIAERAR
ncbi:acyltransferase family protein [Pelomonas sp. UHG3]|uniref:Acyltransferase family protein n=1 Tax=Roseateles hydrophilus TaxID=2975054 RepID=A0ACC6CFE0_9BURK|nr:acyltransferase family protein [Pelomonas sp. UHG3]MCY4746994.1 acyltransferase family protein [Pelomonas sp. UHG3]